MASRHYPHQPHLHLHRTHLPSACCCGCEGGDFANPCFQTLHPSPPPPSPSDPLLQALASQILQSAQFQHLSHYPTLRTKKFQSHYQFQPLGSQNPKRVREQELPQVIHHSTISSLVSRIEALESSLHRVSGSHVPPQSLRQVAASTIQTYFRAFLVRRSRALRELKDLAIIKSRFESLQSSLCNEFYFDRNAISLEIMDLLLHLDSIQGNDPMVKGSKKSLSRDLVQFLDRIDNLSVKRNGGLPLKTMKNTGLGQNVSKSRVSTPKQLKNSENQKGTIEKLKSRIEKICERSKFFENDGRDLDLKRFHHVGDDDDEEEEDESPRIHDKNRDQTRDQNLGNGHQIQPRVKKSVRFAENGSLFRVLGSNSPHEDYGVLDERDERDSGDELVEDIFNEAVEIKEFSEVAEDDEEEAHGEMSDGERNPGRKMSSGNGGSSFSAPLPMKMENKADLIMKNNVNDNKLKIFMTHT
ncbi:BAG family molecular chaperone regulator 8, chloroplastic-like isoform X2 [Cucurbita maxima]|uniref:BAG family molecular chaperone regulator 8, chloroplastic-like isoform X2 n=1 Tax=Cucurbita maxima TaxID=3661 RepID=A0A6J1JKG7_CUCMA|nr:BAG family molecular chaperone regulator 8, chloroplastic-like isoform X2 [Cucurbita maxima]